MKSFSIVPAMRLAGEIVVPGDKSISHRAVMLASLAHGPTVVTGFLPSEDCLCTLRAIQALGVDIEVRDPTTLSIENRLHRLSPAREALDCGNSGTMMRLISGVLAGQSFCSRLVGDASLSKRPMGRIIEPLERMGAHIRAEGEKGTPPLTLEPAELRGIEYELPVASAQVKSCLLLAGLHAQGVTGILEPSPTRDHTERLLAHFGVHPLREGRLILIHGGLTLEGRDLFIPGDFSSAAFWIAGTAAIPGSEIRIRSVGLNPTRTGLVNVLLRMGAQIEESVEESRGDGEPKGSLLIRGGKLRGTKIEKAEIPNLIDELPVLAAIAALAEGETHILGAAELRVKECDRIRCMVENLRRFGVPVDELPDGMIVDGGHLIRAARVSSFGDHRVAMACSILALRADGRSRIDDVGCVETSYPGFFQHLEKLSQASAEAPQGWKDYLPWASPRSKPGSTEGAPRCPVVAIDGPSASGKSTVAKSLAQALGIAYCNSGLVYRAITWDLIAKGVTIEREPAFKATMRQMKIECRIEGNELHVRIGGKEPGLEARSPEVNAAVSHVAASSWLRKRLLPIFRQLAEEHSLVMEGRDIGTAVFPGTRYKFYIDADPKVREQRRQKQGETDSIEDRDWEDRSRTAAPLRCAADAVFLDSSRMTVEEVVRRLLDELRKRGFPLPEKPSAP
ncbi:MAG: 3-phosphoshikimate 1-carboxyvinyltransferase [Methylacidiphilaceae bacterium]|nr:3-phosphoshikimate 1-carboxyvinyltransferase [Candidatus Methylacidiphilaceae bacterium]